MIKASKLLNTGHQTGIQAGTKKTAPKRRLALVWIRKL